uniref:Uncharacterized protein n=1 Tax=Rhizophora mucronata TaxID=61149 RepID=A0A2P2IHQ5_RHIMU
MLKLKGVCRFHECNNQNRHFSWSYCCFFTTSGIKSYIKDSLFAVIFMICLLSTKIVTHPWICTALPAKMWNFLVNTVF